MKRFIVCSVLASGLIIGSAFAAKRDPEVAKVLTSSIPEREARLYGLLWAAQQGGEIDGELPAHAAVRFALMVALGSMVVRALGLPRVDHDDWVALIDRLVDSIRTRRAGGRASA